MSQFQNNPFKQAMKDMRKSMKKKRKGKNAPKASGMPALAAKAPAPTGTPPSPPVDDEEALFAQAMSGVKKLKGAGRDLPKPAPPPAEANGSPQEPAANEAMDELKRLMAGHVDFDLTHSDEFVQGAVHGLDSRHLRKLTAGSLAVEAHLDLHGMNLDQAQESLLFFIRESYLQGKRCVLLVTGRGLRSPGGQGVIKSHVQDWLTRVPLKRVVLAFATAQPRDGGAGALYVLLRKRKKMPGQGKVAWERSLFGF